MKKKILCLSMMVGSMSLAMAVLLVNEQTGNSFVGLGVSSNADYKHYNAIAPTDNEHGCLEFWVSCSDYSYTFTKPTSGTIQEGGNITDNTSFNWNDMDFSDERYVPSINQQKSLGMIPVVQDNRLTYGLFPQTVVDDSNTIDALNALPSSAIHKEIGYYYYNGNFYQSCIGDRCDGDSHFSNGETVVNGTKYWFICEPISWVIMSNTGSTYQVYSDQALHAGINWGYSNSDAYEQSQVRAWLNGIGTHVGNGFFQTALFNSTEYVQSMTLTLDDGSATLNDYVRLLTKDEAINYFGEDNDGARKVAPTDWAAAHHACFQSKSSSFTRWWLCEANTDNTANAWGVGLGGAVGNGGPKTASGSNDRAERPVITITVK